MYWDKLPPISSIHSSEGLPCGYGNGRGLKIVGQRNVVGSSPDMSTVVCGVFVRLSMLHVCLGTSRTAWANTDKATANRKFVHRPLSPSYADCMILVVVEDYYIEITFLTRLVSRLVPV